jgi:segregation and condensation protein B
VEDDIEEEVARSKKQEAGEKQQPESEEPMEEIAPEPMVEEEESATANPKPQAEEGEQGALFEDTTENWEARTDGLTMEGAVEAVLFASDEPVTAAKLAQICETGSERLVNEHIENLNKKFEAGGHSFRIEKIAGGYQMLTLEAYNHWLTKLVKVRGESKLTQAAMETLAIIAYKQPIIRAEVEAIRGVASGEMIRSLMYKGVVKIVGRAEVLGRPLLYGTTKKFLELFGLNGLKDLPKVEELKKPQ